MNIALSRWRSGGLRRLRDACAWSGSIIPLAGVVAAGWALTDQLSGGFLPGGEGPVSGSVIHAQGGAIDDCDRDGLNDAQEEVLGTSPYFADSDGDGFYDVEELARHSDPRIPISRPIPTEISLGMTARGENGELRIVMAIYLADGETSDKYVEVGFMAAGRMLPLAPSEYTSGSVTKLIPAARSTGLIFLLDIPFSPAIVNVYGQVSVYATVSDATTYAVLAADSVDLTGVDGIPTLKKDLGAGRPVVYGGSGSATAGAVYIPISTTGGGDIPATWAESQICYQETMIVGVNNGVITHEVIAAECIDGWDARCRSDCGSSVGESFNTFDPLGLIGG